MHCMFTVICTTYNLNNSVAYVIFCGIRNNTITPLERQHFFFFYIIEQHQKTNFLHQNKYL